MLSKNQFPGWTHNLNNVKPQALSACPENLNGKAGISLSSPIAGIPVSGPVSVKKTVGLFINHPPPSQAFEQEAHNFRVFSKKLRG